MDKTTFLTFQPSVISDENGLPTRFEGVAYSGGIIPGYGWHGDAAIDLSSITLPKSEIFALVDHDPTKRAGRMTARLENDQILVSGSFFSSESGKEVSELFKEGAPWQMSVGLNSKIRQSDTASEQAVNGKTLKINTLFTDASLREVSFVSIGADPNTNVAAFSKHKGNPMEKQDATFASKGKVKCPDCGKEFSPPEETKCSADTDTRLAAEKTRADAAESELTTLKASVRADSIARLSADMQREMSADEIKAFTALGETEFITLTGMLKSARTETPAHLFKEQAISGKDPAKPLTLAEAGAAMTFQLNARPTTILN